MREGCVRPAQPTFHDIVQSQAAALPCCSGGNAHRFKVTSPDCPASCCCSGMQVSSLRLISANGIPVAGPPEVAPAPAPGGFSLCPAISPLCLPFPSTASSAASLWSPHAATLASKLSSECPSIRSCMQGLCPPLHPASCWLQGMGLSGRQPLLLHCWLQLQVNIQQVTCIKI